MSCSIRLRCSTAMTRSGSIRTAALKSAKALSLSGQRYQGTAEGAIATTIIWPKKEPVFDWKFPTVANWPYFNVRSNSRTTMGIAECTRRGCCREGSYRVRIKFPRVVGYRRRTTAGYLPDSQDTAVQKVLQQTEALQAERAARVSAGNRFVGALQSLSE